MHYTFVTASSLTDQDEKKFCVREVQNDYIFTNYAKKVGRYKREGSSFTGATKFVSLCATLMLSSPNWRIQ